MKKIIIYLLIGAVVLLFGISAYKEATKSGAKAKRLPCHEKVKWWAQWIPSGVLFSLLHAKSHAPQPTHWCKSIIIAYFFAMVYPLPISFQFVHVLSHRVVVLNHLNAQNRMHGFHYCCHHVLLRQILRFPLVRMPSDLGQNT